jgi:hypothetical protein
MESKNVKLAAAAVGVYPLMKFLPEVDKSL